MNPILISNVNCSNSSAAKRHLTIGLSILATAAFAIGSTSCATTKGFGQDVEKVGSKIEQKANQTGGAN